MPLVRIDVPDSFSVEKKASIANIVHNTMCATMNVPIADRFQVIAEHSASDIVADPNYLGIERSSDSVFIQVTLNEGRTTELKKAFYLAVATELHETLAIRIEDVLVNLVEVKKENWSFGNGEAQYA